MMRLASDAVADPTFPVLMVLFLAIVVLALVGLTAGLTWLALHYALRQRMLDQPDRRRSHSRATPRGGGIAIVLTIIIGALSLWMLEGWAALPVFALALTAVAGIGWIDDHRPLSARVRFVVHLLASLAFAAWLSRETAKWPQGSLGFVLVLVAVLWLTVCVNFWNFMDGSNGLVTIQSAFVALAIVLWFALDGIFTDTDNPWPFLALAVLGACLGFLPFNFPRARIFMGDVGSGGLGFACGALLLVMVARNPSSLWAMLLIPSALLTDASLTLASRILNQRRWTKPHREHLYQWLIRAGNSHAKVAMLYLAWGVLVTAPCLAAIAHWPRAAPWIALLELAAGATVWFATKRALLRRIRSG